MKKIIWLLVTIILTQFFTLCKAQENSVLNFHSNTSYIWALNVRPIDIQVTNPRVLKAEAVTDLYTMESQLVLTTSEEGISYVSYKANGVTYTIKILVDNMSETDAKLIEIDRPLDLQ